MPFSAAALALLALGANVDGQVGVRAESRGGLIPAGIDSMMTPQGANVFDLEVVPTAGLLVSDSELRLVARYRPRLFFRAYESTSAGGDNQPLFLHQLDLTDRQQLSTRLLLDATANAAYGEVERTAQPVDSAQQVAARSFAYASAGLQAQLSYRITALDTLSIVPRGSAYIPRDAPVLVMGAPVQNFPNQYRGGVDLTYTRSLSVVDNLEATLTSELISFQQQDATQQTPTLTTAGLQGGYRHRFAADTDLTLRAGVLVASEGTEVSLLPDASLALQAELLDDRQARLTATLGAGVDGFADPVRAQRRAVGGSNEQVFVVRATAQAGMLLVLPPSFAVRLAGTFFTPIGNVPEAAVAATGMLPDETLASGRLSLGYQLVPELQLEAGVRASARAPHLGIADVGFREPELVGFLAVTAQIDTGIRVARSTTPGTGY